MKTRTILALALCAFAGPAGAAEHAGSASVRILALNDFHGHIEADRTVTVGGVKKPVGGAAWVAGIVRAKRAAAPGTLLVDAGDMVGASPPVSSLFLDEPTVEFLNLAGFDVGTLGNHEFDRGIASMKRLWRGGVSRDSRYYPRPFPGARFPIVCANILDARTGKPLFAPYTIRNVHGVRVGFIGAVTADLPNVTSARARAGIRETDPVQAVNQWARYLGSHGVHAIVVLMHEGGEQKPPEPGGTLTGPIVDVARRLDRDVDVIVSGHSHQYSNAFVGRILITQARSQGTALADIRLTVDRGSGDVIRKSASIEDTTHDGVTPARDVAAMVKGYQDAAAPRINRVVGEIAADMPAYGHPESMLGDLIADAQREAVGADVAFMNPGGVRAGLTRGRVTWGQAFTAQPFNNQVVTLKMTGVGIKAVLEQQWGAGSGGDERAVFLLPSGVSYRYDAARPIGDRVLDLEIGGRPVDQSRVYSVAVNSFLADGGDGFSEFSRATERILGPNDLDALIAYLAAHPGVAPVTGRIRTTAPADSVQ